MPHNVESLFSSDLPIYGICPAQEMLSLIVCHKCGISIKPQALLQHYGQLYYLLLQLCGQLHYALLQHYGQLHYLLLQVCGQLRYALLQHYDQLYYLLLQVCGQLRYALLQHYDQLYQALL